MPSRPLPRLLVAAAVVVAACSLPTDVCGCPPARSHVIVLGTVADAQGHPVAGAQFYLDGAPADRSWPPLSGGGSWGARSDSNGEYRGTAYSTWSPGMLELRLAVVAPGRADTVHVSGGLAPFRLDRERPDSVRVDVHLP